MMDGGLDKDFRRRGFVSEIIRRLVELENFMRSERAKMASGRTILLANQTFYVRTDGSDSNNGLTNSASGAFLTIQKAIDVVCSLDLSIYAVTIQLGPGTYSSTRNILNNYIGVGPVTIVGDTATPSNVSVTTTGACFLARNSNKSIWVIDGITLTNTAGTDFGCLLSDGGYIQFQRVVFKAGVAGGGHIYSTGFGRIDAVGDYTIDGIGAGGYHIFVDTNSYFIYNVTATLTITAGAKAWSQFAYASSTGILFCWSPTVTITGGVNTGQRYYADLNSVIMTGGGGPNYFPGNVAGATASGGQYL